METVEVKISDISPRCLTSSAGNELLNLLNSYLCEDKKVVLDFNGITMFASLYFNNSITKLIPNFPVSLIKKRVIVTNINETGQKALSRSLEVGSKFYKLSDDERQQITAIIKKNLSDWHEQ